MKKVVKYKKSLYTSSNSKGERLGWTYVEDVQNVPLVDLLSERKRVVLKSDSTPLLVP